VTPEPSFARKGKLFFISSLEKHGDLSSLLAEIEFVFKNPQTREVVLYFKQRFRPFPNVIVPLACAIDHLRRSGRNVRVNDTFGELEETGYISPHRIEAPESIKKCPEGIVWHFEAPREIYSIVGKTIDYLYTKLEWERGTLHALEWSLYELLDNVFQHSKAHAGFFMFQVQEKHRRLSYCVADQGQGIYQSFSGSKYNPTNPLDAITLAVRKGVTRNSTTNMGNGLWGATEIVARSKGQITISSGGAALFFNRVTGVMKNIPRVKVLDRSLPGTLIDAQVDASVGVQMSEMFEPLENPVNLRVEALEDVQGAARVKLKHMTFGVATREAGELVRIYTSNLLSETVGHVVVDLSGVGIISSSFADEFIAKLHKKIGARAFDERVFFSGVNETNNVIIQNALAQRLRTV
jgi:hypothetical protein